MTKEMPTVWARQPKRQQRDQPALSREQIVSAALELLDAEGPEALSMRKLGARLNAGATSMYSHVANKEELLELVVDDVHGEIQLPETPANWREAVSGCAHSLRDTYLRHPWMAATVGSVPLINISPNMLRMSDYLLQALTSAGFSYKAADQALNAIAAYLIGAATFEAAWLVTIQRSGQSEEQWLEKLMPAAEEAIKNYPHVLQAYQAQTEQSDNSREANFSNGLTCILDGLEARLEKV
ncbi:MAG: TetR/AcrR family transcriptional regulator [Corynebacteriales bacterium]|nr:TetR/AcrR family transcriptional regulator [Mycobacteriales bacterium]